jgi:hypothetical protein
LSSLLSCSLLPGFNYVVRTTATTSLFGSRLTLLLTFNCFTTALHSLRFLTILPATQSFTPLFSLAKHYDSGFNCVIRTTTITPPVWFKTLSFTYFHDYLQAYRALANSTDDAISSSRLLLLCSLLPSITIQASILSIRTRTRSSFSSGLSFYARITIALQLLCIRFDFR